MADISSIDSPYIFEGSAENFNALVLGNSNQGPVLVNFWSPKAGPCLRLYPLLDKIIHEFAGKMLLVNINTENQFGTAKEYGVNSVPTLKLFTQKQITETIHGFKNETELREILGRYIADESDLIIAKAFELNRTDNKKRSYQLLADAASQNVDNLRFPLTLAKLLLRDNELQKAFELLNSLPAAFKTTEQVSTLFAHISFLLAAQDPADIATLESRLENDANNLSLYFTLAAKNLVRDDYENALKYLLVILRKDSEFNDGIARKGIRAIMQLLNSQDPLVVKYRQEMNLYMH